MGRQAEPNGDQAVKEHKTSPLCWAARLVALGYGLLIALYALSALILTLIGSLSRGESWGSVFWPLFWLPFFIPLVLAVVAWRWHLVGGALITVGGVALYLFFIFSGNVQWGIHLYVLPLLAGGLLHLLAWYKEKKTSQVPQTA